VSILTMNLTRVLWFATDCSVPSCLQGYPKPCALEWAIDV
jgi:hypothetical protein